MNIVLHNDRSLGKPVRRGNLYEMRATHPKRRFVYKLVVAVLGDESNPLYNKRAPWNNVVLLHLTRDGVITGSAVLPEPYVRDHHYLVGRVPTEEHKWFQFNIRELRVGDEYLVA